MIKVPSLALPDQLPHPDAIQSWRQNRYSYDPQGWELEYEGYRYLGRLPNDELADRYESILRNMRALISPDRHVIPSITFLSSWYWYRKEHQTRLEFFLRGTSPPMTPPAKPLDNPQPNAPVRPRSPNAGDVVFRYGEAKYMRPLVQEGAVRILPASEYQWAEGYARGDNEVEKCSFAPGQYTRILTQDGNKIPIIGDLKRATSFPDYYVLCTACDWDDALFDDFRADACVVITQPETFANRLAQVAEAQLPGWLFYHGAVEYFDPFETRLRQGITPSLHKDFRFAYQREYRFSWTPLRGELEKGCIELALGSLEGIAELHFKPRMDVVHGANSK